jgi:two-component system chemotaxis sensor kinase CheA
MFEKAATGSTPRLTPADKAALVTDGKPSLAQPSQAETSSNELPQNADAPQAPGPSPAPAADEKAATMQSALNADPSLLADFVNESRDHIHTAETFLLELETSPTNGESINSVFRAWHTIKGVAGFLGLRETATLAHAMENLMDLARKGELVLNAEYIDVLLEGNDCLKELIEIVEAGISGASLRTPESFHSIIDKLSSPGSIGHGAVGGEPVKKVGEILVENGVAAPQDVENALKLQQEGDPRKLGEILIGDKNIPARAVAGALAAQTASRQSATVEETIRVPVGRIDQLVDSIGEAVIAQSMINADASIKKIADQTLHTKIEHSEMIMRQIQELAMSLRMVSIKSTFQKMARLVRDLSKKSNKDVNFVTEGEDTELDKSVVEKIGDPLIHMIRNSVDHGIESPQDRRKTGKPSHATVILRAYQKAGNIYIEVVDDGKGLDKEAIFSKAVSKGLCKKNDGLSEQEIYAFIFLPGFSTAKVITDVSGRGVGMDVVRRNIEALRGSVEIQSQQGVGTTFTIRLPLTLAIVDGMIVRSKGDTYIIPTLSIVESIRPTADQRKSVLKIGEMINVRGELIPLVNLARIFDKTNGHYGASEGVVMIVEDMLGKKIGLEIDEIMGQQQVVIKNLGVGIGDVPGISGGAIMSDGHVSLILDIGGIAKMMDG